VLFSMCSMLNMFCVTMNAQHIRCEEAAWLQLQHACVKLATTRRAASAMQVLSATKHWNKLADYARLVLLCGAFHEWSEYLEWLFSGD
jgi:hypothetical protein